MAAGMGIAVSFNPFPPHPLQTMMFPEVFPCTPTAEHSCYPMILPSSHTQNTFSIFSSRFLILCLCMCLVGVLYTGVQCQGGQKRVEIPWIWT